MLRVVILTRQNDKEYWQERFAESYSGPIDIKLQEEFPSTNNFDLIILDLSSTQQQSAFTIQPKDILASLSQLLVNKKFIITTDKKDVDLAIEAIKLGAIGFLVKPINKAELKATLDRLQQETTKQSGAPQKNKAKVITMYSYKGGTGVSTACANLGYTIATLFQKKTLIIDAAGFSNHATVLLNVVPKCTLGDVSTAEGQIDEHYLANAVRQVSPTLGVIGGLLKIEDVTNVNVTQINNLVRVASNIYDYILIDTSTHALDELTMSLTQMADEIILLTTFDLLAIKDNRFYVQALKEIGIEESKIKAVINRQDWFVGSLEPELIQKQMNHPIFHALPNDWELCVEAANYGRPIIEFAPNSQLATAYRILAGKITGLDVSEPTPGAEGASDEGADKDKTGKKKGILNWF